MNAQRLHRCWREKIVSIWVHEDPSLISSTHIKTWEGGDCRISRVWCLDSLAKLVSSRLMRDLVSKTGWTPLLEHTCGTPTHTNKLNFKIQVPTKVPN